MKAKINLITIWTDDIKIMSDFYSDVLGFEVIENLGNYVEFYNEGVRFAICSREVMVGYCDNYLQPAAGQAFELAFPCETPAEVDVTYAELIEKGAKPIHTPQNMPWKQRTALFADPDGNIHEIFAYIK